MNALVRYWHRRGFDIQSPFAYDFVCRVAQGKRSERMQRLQAWIDKSEDECRLVEHIDRENKELWEELIEDESATFVFDMKDVGLIVYRKGCAKRTFYL